MKKIVLLLIVLFQVFFLAPLAYSYSARISQIDKSKFPEIQLYVSITDSNGNPVQSLSAENFSVKEEGKEVKMSVKKGDKVLYGKYSGTEVKVDGKEYLIMRESDIYGIVN